MSDSASIYVAAGVDGITVNKEMDEAQLTNGNQMQIRYPAIVYITAKASDNGEDSAFTIEAFFSPTKSDTPITDGGKDGGTEIITN